MGVRIPRNRGTVLWFAAGLFFSAPLVEFYYYKGELDRGAYPPDADAILIPVYWFTSGLLMMSPVILAFIWLCVRRYPGGVSLLIWPQNQPWWCWLASAALGAFAVLEVLGTPWTPWSAHWLDGLQTLAFVYLALILRASLAGSASVPIAEHAA